jgi:hypothetical protein
MADEEAGTRRDWEPIQEDPGESKTDRLRIAGGWLYRTIVHDAAVAVVFVPSDIIRPAE